MSFDVSILLRARYGKAHCGSERRGRSCLIEPGKQRLWLATALIAISCAAGCSTVGSVGPGTSQDAYYLGVIRVQTNGDGSPEVPKVQRISGVGFHFDNGLTAGYFSRLQISVPQDCRVIVINRNEHADGHIQELLTRLGGKSICATELFD